MSSDDITAIPTAEVARLAQESDDDAREEILRRDLYLAGLDAALEVCMRADQLQDQQAAKAAGRPVDVLATPKIHASARAIMDAKGDRLAALADGSVLLWDGTTSGEELRLLRERAGLSVRHAAVKLGVAASTIQRWEAGEAEPPASMVVLLARLARFPVGIRVTSPALRPGSPMELIAQTLNRLAARDEPIDPDWGFELPRRERAE